MSTETRVAGRELDSEVAVRVMGRRHLKGAEVPPFFAHRDEPDENQEVWFSDDDQSWYCGPCGTLPSFSSDREAALGVVDAMFAKGYACAIDIEGTPDAPVVGVMFHRGHGESHDAEAATLPLAVCLASLAAMQDSAEAG